MSVHFSCGFLLVSKNSVILLINKVEKSFRAKKERNTKGDIRLYESEE